MKSRNIKTRLAAFGLALLMGHSPLGNLADVHAAETKNPSEPVTESAEISETEQTEEVSEAAKHLVTAEDITKDISDKDFMVETCMEGIPHFPAYRGIALRGIALFPEIHQHRGALLLFIQKPRQFLEADAVHIMR